MTQANLSRKLVIKKVVDGGVPSRVIWIFMLVYIFAAYLFDRRCSCYFLKRLFWKTCVEMWQQSYRGVLMMPCRPTDLSGGSSSKHFRGSVAGKSTVNARTTLASGSGCASKLLGVAVCAVCAVCEKKTWPNTAGRVSFLPAVRRSKTGTNDYGVISYS